MIAPILSSLVVGAAALALAYGLGVSAEPALIRSLLAAWLVIMAAPLGALPILMVLDLAGRGAGAGPRALRLILAALPAAALLGAVPLAAMLVMPSHIDLGGLYGWSTGGLSGRAARWFTPHAFILRSFIYLIVWVALALVFGQPAAVLSLRRRRLAALGLGLHLALGSLAAFDWTMSLDLDLTSSVFGLLLMSLQSALALSVALLITLAGDRAAPPPRDLVLTLLVCVMLAAFLQFTQYLVVWSANLPHEVLWYQRRLAGLGSGLSIAAALVVALSAVVMAPAAIAARRGPVAGASLLLVLVALADLLWLVTPSWRGVFVVTPLDGLALVGQGGIVAAGALLVDMARKGLPHG